MKYITKMKIYCSAKELTKEEIFEKKHGNPFTALKKEPSRLQVWLKTEEDSCHGSGRNVKSKILVELIKCITLLSSTK